MASAGNGLEQELIKSGKSLRDPPSSVEELLTLLDKVEGLLADVEQTPSEVMRNAVSPSLEALVGDKLFGHPDVDVRVAVASCISEITRITAPNAPYNDERMKDVFKLIVSSFEDLPDKSSRSYAKRVSMLETVARVRSCVVMLDLDCDTLIIQMFQYFLKAIRDYHPESVFSSMETIMTLVIEEIEDVPPEILSTLLASLRKDNKEVLPVSRKLAENVVQSCATKLKPTINSLGVSVDDYCDVIAAICNETSCSPNQNEASANEPSVIAGAQSEPMHAAEDGSNEAVSNGGTGVGKDKPLSDSSMKKEQQHEEPDNHPMDVDNHNILPDRREIEVADNTEKVDKQISDRGVIESAALQEQESQHALGIDDEKERTRQEESKEDGKSAPASSDEKASAKSNEHAKDGKESGTKDGKESGSKDGKESGTKDGKESGTKDGKELGTKDRKESGTNDGKKAGAMDGKGAAAEDGKEVAAKDGKEAAAEDGKEVVAEDEKEVGAKLLMGKPEQDEFTKVPSSSQLDKTQQKVAGHRKKRARSGKEVKPSTDEASEEASDPDERTAVTGDRKKRARSVKEVKAPIDEASVMVSEEAIDAEGRTLVTGDNSKKGISIDSDSEEKPLKQLGKKGQAKDVLSEKSLKQKEKKKQPQEKGVLKHVSKTLVKDDKITPSKAATKVNKNVNGLKEERKVIPKTKQASSAEKASDIEDYGENLVGARIKVWWPIDKQFYKGVVHSYDAAKKKHLVLYDDGDEEILKLKKERWEFLDGGAKPKGEEAVSPASPRSSLDRTKHRKAKMGDGQSSKHGKMDAPAKRSGAGSSGKLRAAAAGRKSKADGGRSESKVKESSKIGDESGNDSLDEKKQGDKSRGGVSKLSSRTKVKTVKDDEKSMKLKESAKSSKSKQMPLKSSSGSKGKPSPRSVEKPRKSGKSKSESSKAEESVEKGTAYSGKGLEKLKGKSRSSSETKGSESNTGTKRKR